MITSTATLLVTLLALFHPTARTRCIERRAPEIVAEASASAERHGVPPAIMLSIGLHESAFGCDPASGGSWGAPLSRRHRGFGVRTGNGERSASALALGFRMCGTWPGAVAMFRCGRCRCGALVGYSPANAMRLAQQIDPELR